MTIFRAATPMPFKLTGDRRPTPTPFKILLLYLSRVNEKKIIIVDKISPPRTRLTCGYSRYKAQPLYLFIYSDEAYFYLTLPINKQNNRNWRESSPYQGIEIHLHDEKVLVWWTIFAKRIFGPYFF